MTQENQNPEQENPSVENPSDAAPEASAVKTPEQEIAELNQKIGDLQDNFLRAKAEG
jgi:molecular chaperone GrpE